MPRSTKLVPKRDDATLVRFFEGAANIVGASSVNLIVDGQDRNFVLTLGTVGSSSDWIRESEFHSIVTVGISVDRVQISIDRRPEAHRENRIDVTLLDALVINVEPNHTTNIPTLDDDQVASLIVLVDQTFGSDVNLASQAYRDPKTFQTVLRSHQTIIERLQKMTLEVGEQAADTRRKLEDEYLSLKKQLEEQVSAERIENQKTADEERSLLAQRADEVAERARALDDRNNTHVRRELFEKTRTLLADRFKKLNLTPQTTSARTPIHVGVAGSAIIFGVLIYAFTSEALTVIARADSSMTERVLVIAKSATASLAFLGIVSWYLRWMNRWFERLADSEFQLKQFELDITRAQWVVETAFEWKMSQQSPIPDQLLDNVSRNLFVNAEKDAAADMHPADYLASALLGKASNVKLAVPGAEIELGPKALKDAGK